MAAQTTSIADMVTFYGEQNMSVEDLLSVTLGKDVALALVGKYGSLRRASNAGIAELKSIVGVGKGKASVIKAVFELARRLSAEELKKGVVINSPEVAYELFGPRLRDLHREVFQVAFLNGRNEVIATRQISDGSPTSAVPSIYAILHIAIGIGAAAIVCVHNHPSGSTAPSREDKRFTKELNEACMVTDMKLLDHIIIGDDGYFSFADQGEL